MIRVRVSLPYSYLTLQCNEFSAAAALPCTGDLNITPAPWTTAIDTTFSSSVLLRSLVFSTDRISV